MFMTVEERNSNMNIFINFQSSADSLNFQFDLDFPINLTNACNSNRST